MVATILQPPLSTNFRIFTNQTFRGLRDSRVWAEPIPLNTEHSKSSLTQLQRLQARGSQDSSDQATLLQLTDWYLKIGQELYQDESQKRQPFDEDARLARKALDLEENNAKAHYLYAANLGSSAQIKGVTASALRVKTLKIQMQRALELSPDHAPSLHMMGIILEELPWFLEGDAEMTIRCLVPAREVKPDYTQARLDLSKIYIKRQNHSAVEDEFLKILNEQSPSPAQESWRPDQQKAEKLLDSLTIHHYSRVGAIATHPLS